MLAQHEKAGIYRTMQCIQDPGNLEADLQAGGFAGYALLWLFLVCTIMVCAFSCNILIWHFLLFIQPSCLLSGGSNSNALQCTLQCSSEAYLSASHRSHLSQIQSARPLLSALQRFSLSASQGHEQSDLILPVLHSSPNKLLMQRSMLYRASHSNACLHGWVLSRASILHSTVGRSIQRCRATSCGSAWRSPSLELTFKK